MNPVVLPAAPVLALDRNNTRLARRIGVSVRTVVRWRHHHTDLSPATAEHCADALGLHPSMLWPDYYDVVVAPCGTRRAYDAGCRCSECKTGRVEAWRVRRQRARVGGRR